MKGLVHFIQEFYNNKGFWVAASTMANKLCIVVVSVYLIRVLDKELLGQLTVAITIIAFVLRFSGLGANIGLLRYGPITKNHKKRTQLASYVFFKGNLANLGLLALTIFAAYCFIEDTLVFLFLGLLAFRLISDFSNVFLQCYFRVFKENQTMAKFDLVNALIYLTLGLTLVYFFKEKGYIVALLVSPLISFALFLPKVLRAKPQLTWMSTEVKETKFWRYSLLGSSSSMVAQLIFFVDILIIKMFLDYEDVAEYRVASLIPLNLLILPMIFMKTDLARITENYLNKRFLVQYYKNYARLFLILSVLGMLIAIFLGRWILQLFGEQYEPYNIFLILLAASLSSISIRVPLGNVIATLGKVQVNVIVAIITLLVAIVSNYFMIQAYGLIGAAWATFITLNISGIINLIYFLYYLKRLDDPTFNRKQ